MDEAEYFSDDSDATRSPPSDVKKKISSIGRRLAAVASSVGGAIARSAEAAAEVLADADLRRRGAQVIADNASKAAKGIQHGLQTSATSIQRGLQTVQRGPKSITAVLLRVQHQIEQQRMAALLEEQRDAPVDVQVGCQLYEDSPQELRSRLWMALLEHPELVAEYQAMLAVHMEQRASCPADSPTASPSSFATPLPIARPSWATAPAPEEAEQCAELGVGEAEGREGADEGRKGTPKLEAGGSMAQSSGVPTSLAATASSPATSPDGDAAPPAASSAGSGSEPREGDSLLVAEREVAGCSTPAAAPAVTESHMAGTDGHAAGSDSEAVVQDVGHLSPDVGHLSPSTSHCSSGAASPVGRQSSTNRPHPCASSSRDRKLVVAGAVCGSGCTPTSSDSSSCSGGWAGVGSEEWEVVEESKRRQGQPLLVVGSTGARDVYSREQEAFRNKLMAAMMAVPWPLPTEYPEECRYATLLQISVGQEEVDEVISRDIHRTFPEHPLFGFEQGQQALFRVLKAYSLHDIEVGYCQGMAFVAGLLLFYMNEEPAFQMFCRLLGASGPNLRRLYLPGLEGLKAELRQFEFLMGRYLPNLKGHLEAYGVVPVLFASQWFLTAFSCPFPVHFACRLLDVMAVEGNDTIMLRTALTIMAECEADLFMLDDFEEIITYLKVEPVQWPLHRIRRVLNAAVHSSITQHDLADSAAAVDQGYAGSLARNTSSMDAEGPPGLFFPTSAAPDGAPAEGPDAPTAVVAGPGPAIATAAERARSTRHGHSRGPSLGQVAAGSSDHSRHASLGAAIYESSATGAGLAQQQQGEEGGDVAVQGGEGDDLEAELARHQADLDEEYMAMVLALDMVWAGESGDAASNAYEAALASAPTTPSSQQPASQQQQELRY